MGKRIWRYKEAISISGCLDKETSGDIGKGGIFTHALLLTLDMLSQSLVHGMVANKEYSVEAIWNATLEEKQKRWPKSAQHISIENTDSIEPNDMWWPLVPRGL